MQIAQVGLPAYAYNDIRIGLYLNEKCYDFEAPVGREIVEVLEWCSFYQGQKFYGD